MPPKKKATNQTSKKTEKKEKAKIVEDKTFGLKNKKSAKVQKYVANVKQQVDNKGDPRAIKAEQAKRKAMEDKKKAAELLKKEKALLEKNLVPAKGKLPLSAALEESDKEDEDLNMNKANVDDDNITLEEWIEKQKSSLGATDKLTPVNDETFAIWKAKKNAEKAASEERRRKRIASGKETRGLSGRELFEYKAPSLDQEGDLDEDDEYYNLDEFEINEDLLNEELFEGEDLEQLTLEDQEESNPVASGSGTNGT